MAKNPSGGAPVSSRTSRCLGPTLKNQRQHGRAVPLAVRAGDAGTMGGIFEESAYHLGMVDTA